MMILGSRLFAGVCAAALCGLSANAASAAVYDFNVNYFGSNIATLGAGDDPVGTTLNAGDSFTYTLKGANGYFSTTTGGYIFPFIALAINESGERFNDFTVTLSYLGSSVFTFSEVGASTKFVHLGANAAPLPGGLIFDEITLSDSITGDSGTIGSLLPIFGSPDQSPISPGVVKYTIGTPGVPEPASWAMMIGGFALAGGALRGRRKFGASFA